MDLIAKAVTLKSIKLHDPSVKELVFSAKHAVLYTFSATKGTWVNPVIIMHSHSIIDIFRKRQKRRAAWQFIDKQQQCQILLLLLPLSCSF